MGLSDIKKLTESLLHRVKNVRKNKHCTVTHTYGIQKNGTDEPICRAAMETQRTDLWPPRGKERVAQTETVAWKHTHHHV